MSTNEKLQQIFTDNNTAPKTEDTLTETKVVTMASIIGMAAGGFLCGWGLFHHSPAKMIIFGLITVICATFLCANSKTTKKQ